MGGDTRSWLVAMLQFWSIPLKMYLTVFLNKQLFNFASECCWSPAAPLQPLPIYMQSWTDWAHSEGQWAPSSMLSGILLHPPCSCSQVVHRSGWRHSDCTQLHIKIEYGWVGSESTVSAFTSVHPLLPTCQILTCDCEQLQGGCRHSGGGAAFCGLTQVVPNSLRKAIHRRSLFRVAAM